MPDNLPEKVIYGMVEMKRGEKSLRGYILSSLKMITADTNLRKLFYLL